MIESTMDQMRIMRKQLLDALRVNKAEHHATFIQAQTGYRDAVIEELDRMLTDARAGSKIKRHLTMPEPEDHTDDYDRAITMLEMCVDDEIVITSHDFTQYVMDNWGWKKQWSETVSNYHIPV